MQAKVVSDNNQVKKKNNLNNPNKPSKIMSKNNKFSNKNNHDSRKNSAQKKIIQSFKRIGKCLNHVNRNDMPADGYEKICLILINNFNEDKPELQNMTMNDGFLIGLHHYRLGFKVFYLYNCKHENYPNYLQFFLIHTTDALTVFYSDTGNATNGNNDIELKNKNEISNQFSNIIAQSNCKCKVVFISDCNLNGSIFDIRSKCKANDPNPSKFISFSVNKKSDSKPTEEKRSHGTFTYYFSKVIYECPDITPKRLVERINSSIKGFNETFICETTKLDLENEPIFNIIAK